MSEGQEVEKLGPEAQESASRMLADLNQDQYFEDLKDPIVRENVGSLVLKSARVGLELNANSLDYAVEIYGGRLGVSQTEFVEFFDDINEELFELDPQKAEDELRLLHLSLEFYEYDGLSFSSQKERLGQEETLRRVEIVNRLRGTARTIEELSGNQLDIEEFSQLDLEYGSYVRQLEAQALQSAGDGRIPNLGSKLIVDASSAELEAFLQQRNTTGLPEGIEADLPTEDS